MELELITIEQAQSNVLKEPAQTLEFPLSKTDQDLIEAMKEKIMTLGGVGLAAPQVNISKRIAVIYIPENAVLLRDNARPYPPHVLINPSYEAASDAMAHDFEGCYSVQSKMGVVPRYQSIRLRYQDEQGQVHERIESNFYARVCQHEIDHLNGTLITDRLTPDCIQGSQEEMLALRRQQLSPEQRRQFDELIKKKFPEE